jgi:hypothetical protein
MRRCPECWSWAVRLLRNVERIANVGYYRCAECGQVWVADDRGLEQMMFMLQVDERTLAGRSN